MFDLDVSKMIVVGIVALAVIPPKDLPRVMRTVGQAVGKMRRMAAEFQGQFMDAMREVEREADLESVKKEFQAINEQTKIDTNFDPVGIMRDDMTKAVQSPVEIANSEIAKSEIAKSEIGAPEVGKLDIAPTASEPPEEAPTTARVEMETRPEAAPPARQSAAE